MKVTHYYVGRPTEGMRKQQAIWARGRNESHSPLVYLQRPKWITDDDAWNKIVNSIQLMLPKNFEVT